MLILRRLTVPDLTPNVGMWWYFFTEMFDHFRAFFLGVFQVSSLRPFQPVSVPGLGPVHLCLSRLGPRHHLHHSTLPASIA